MRTKKSRIKVVLAAVTLAMLTQTFFCYGTFAADAGTVAESNYYPTRAFANSADGGVILSWVNPAVAPTAIKVYNITDGAEVQVTAELCGNNPLTKQGTFDRPLLASGCDWIHIDGLTNGKTYQFKVVFSFSDAEDTIYYMTATPQANGLLGFKLGDNGWFINSTSTAAAPKPMDISLDNKVYHGDGENGTSLRFDGNWAAGINKAVNYLYKKPLLSADGLNKTYEFSYYIKTDKAQFFNMLMNTAQFKATLGDGTEYSIDNGYALSVAKDDSVSPTTNDFRTDPVTISDWEKQTYKYTYTDANSSFLTIGQQFAGTVWLDDFEMYELDAAGNRVLDENGTEVNLIGDGDFEDISEGNALELADVEAMSGVGEITLSWQEDESLAEVNIYEKKMMNIY